MRGRPNQTTLALQAVPPGRADYPYARLVAKGFDVHVADGMTVSARDRNAKAVVCLFPTPSSPCALRGTFESHGLVCASLPPLSALSLSSLAVTSFYLLDRPYTLKTRGLMTLPVPLPTGPSVPACLQKAGLLTVSAYDALDVDTIGISEITLDAGSPVRALVLQYASGACGLCDVGSKVKCPHVELTHLLKVLRQLNNHI